MPGEAFGSTEVPVYRDIVCRWAEVPVYRHRDSIQGVTGGKDQTSGGCSLC